MASSTAKRPAVSIITLLQPLALASAIPALAMATGIVISDHYKPQHQLVLQQYATDR